MKKVKPRRFRHAPNIRANSEALNSTCWSEAEVLILMPGSR